MSIYAVEPHHNIPSCNGFAVTMLSSAGPVKSLQRQCILDSCSLHLYNLPFTHSALGSEPPGSVGRDSECRYLCNGKETGSVYRNAALLQSTRCPWPLLLPPLCLHPSMLRKSPKLNATSLPLPFQQRSSIDGALHHGVILWLLTAVGCVQKYKTINLEVGDMS